jgi:membrane-associated protease RseP (regulator of RpoE activity)
MPAVGLVEFRDGDSVAGGQGGVIAEVPTVEESQASEPLRWTFQQVQDVVDEPLRTGPVTYLGVSASPPPRELAAHLPIPRDTGLVVEGLVPDGPAAKAGLEQNDVLTRLDDQILIHPRQLSVLVANRKEGDVVKVSFIRRGETKELDVTLGTREVKAPGHAAHDVTWKNKDVVIAGDSVAPLRTFVRRFNLPPDAALKQAEAEMAVARAKADAVMARAHAAAAGKVQQDASDAVASEHKAAENSQKAEIDEIRRKLDEVLKRLDEKK